MTEPKHTRGELSVGMSNGANISNLYIHKGPTPMDSEPVCQVNGIPLNTCTEEIQLNNRSERYGEGLSNAARLVRGWNLLNRLDEMGVSAEQVPGIIEALREIKDMGISEAESGEAQDVAEKALTKKG